MSAEPAANRETDEQFTSFHTAGCYPVPIRFLYGTAAQINFWDVIYCRAHKGGGVFETSTPELVEQVGFVRQEIRPLLREAIERGELIEDISFESGRRFQLKIPGFDRLRKGIIWKPLGYIENGWHRVVTPAIPKRVLNLYLQQPRKRVYDLDPEYIATRCKRYFPYGDYKPVAPLNLSDVSKALWLLIRLGLFVPEGDGYRIDWTAFNQPAPAIAPSFDAPDLRERPLFRKYLAIDPECAERAFELLLMGQYDMEMHFADIFRDLAYIFSDDDYQLLRNKVHKRCRKPPSPNRWKETWRVFQNEMNRRTQEIRSPKVVLSMAESALAAAPLAADLSHLAKPVSAVVFVARVEQPWYFQDTAVVHMDVLSFDNLLFSRSRSAEDPEVRVAFRSAQWSDAVKHLMLCVRCDRPLPGVHVEAWLEVKSQR